MREDDDKSESGHNSNSKDSIEEPNEEAEESDGLSRMSEQEQELNKDGQNGDQQPAANTEGGTPVESDTNGESKQSQGDPRGSSDTEDKQAELSREIESLRERVDKLDSDLSDYQRRTEHELEELKKYTVEDVASELLEVKDSLEDAIEVENLDEGAEQRLNIVVKQFENRLTSGRIEAYEPEPGDLLDSKYHRVADKVSTANYEDGEIVRALTTGYKTHDRVIRPANVVVATD
jgi:molecular chaperone GrpE